MPSRKKRPDQPLVLAVDVGNTYIHFALLRGTRIKSLPGIETALPVPAISRKLKILFQKLQRDGVPVDRVIICSVVPRVTVVLKTMLKKQLGVSALVVGKDVAVPIINRYKNPRQVGQDRLVVAYAAAGHYGTPAVVIDLGTAITLDVISRRGEYLGGIILPGIRMTAETLFERTALLPLAHIKKPRSLIGKDTEESILSGIFYGYGEMLQGLVRRLTGKVATNPKVIVTGGHAQLMHEFIVAGNSSGKIPVIDRDLVFKGLALLSDCP